MILFVEKILQNIRLHMSESMQKCKNLYTVEAITNVYILHKRFVSVFKI